LRTDRGRQLGTPNKVTVEARLFCASIVDDPDYLARLRDRALSGQPPALEAMLWHYAKGKPAEHVEVAGGLKLVERLNAARLRFSDARDGHLREELERTPARSTPGKSDSHLATAVAIQSVHERLRRRPGYTECPSFWGQRARCRLLARTILDTVSSNRSAIRSVRTPSQRRGGIRSLGSAAAIGSDAGPRTALFPA
jgi:hypothetical protein